MTLEPLAFVIFTIVGADVEQFEISTPKWLNCRSEAPLIADWIEAEGSTVVSYQCVYGNGPMTSPRPVARPVGVDI